MFADTVNVLFLLCYADQILQTFEVLHLKKDFFIFLIPESFYTLFHITIELHHKKRNTANIRLWFYSHLVL